MCTLLDAAMGFALQLPACRPVPRALRALCGSTGCASAPRACAPHSRPTLRCAAAGGKDRGEWTRFLAWSESDGSHRARVECVVVDGGGTAEVTVVAPDRPGLLSDVTATIASLGLNIEKAKVTTPSSTVKDTFRVTCQGGEALTETRLASIRTAIVNAASASAISKTAASTQPRAVDAKVEVMSFEDPAAVSGMSRPTWIIGISVEDSPGLLSKMMKAMSELGLDVLSADIKTTHGTGMIKFQVLRREGLKPQAVVDAIKAALKHA